MAIKAYRPITPAQRQKTTEDYDQITTNKPMKSLLKAKSRCPNPKRKSGSSEPVSCAEKVPDRLCRCPFPIQNGRRTSLW